MANQPPEENWQVRLVRPGLPGMEHLPELGLPDLSRLPWLNHPIRPADIGGALRDAMMARENMLEDVNYQKVVPNHFIIEVSDGNYARQFRPIEGQIVRQWSERLMEELVTANSRRGRKEFHFAGRLRIEVRASANLRDNEARVLSRIEPDASPRAPQAPARGQTRSPGMPNIVPGPRVTPPPAARPRAVPPLRQGGPPTTVPDRPQARSAAANVPPGAEGPGRGLSAFLELVPTGQRWALYPGINTIGRSDSCQIYLDMPAVQEKRLVSGQHAFIDIQNGVCMLYDGSPDGRPSANGTYVNLRRVPPSGYRLQNGDAIVLAAVDPLYPRSDTPGVVTFYFWANR
jgi:hypothetical protein